MHINNTARLLELYITNVRTYMESGTSDNGLMSSIEEKLDIAPHFAQAYRKEFLAFVQRTTNQGKNFTPDINHRLNQALQRTLKEQKQ